MSIVQAVEKYKKDLNKLKRLKIINYSIAAASIIIVIVWVVLYLFDYVDSTGATLSGILMAVLAVDMLAVYLAYIKPQKKKIIDEGHKEIIKILVNENFPNCVYNAEPNFRDGITSADIRSTGLIPKWTNAINITHNIKSIYKGVPFRFCSVEAYNYDKYTIRSESYTKYNKESDIKEVSFCGCWFVFNCHIELNSSIMIVSKHSKSEEEFVYKQKISPLCRINTPDSDFNRLFSVFSYDIESPQKILTEKFVNNLLRLQNKIKSAIYIYIDNGIIHVGVERNKRFFAPILSVFGSVEDMIKSAYNDMDFIFDCLNAFDLSEYVTKSYTEFKTENDSIYYTGKDVDTNYYI